jgi:hypothetical protein
VVATRVIVGIVAGALTAAAAVAMPAIGAPDRVQRARALPISIATFFTPASADPKLAALIARSGFGATPFRFTPADSRNASRRVVDIAKPRSVVPGVIPPRVTGDTTSVGLAPIAFNLASSDALKHFVLSGDLAKVDLATVSGSRKSTDSSAIYSGRRATAKLTAHTDQPTPGATHLIGVPSYSIDVGGSYSLTKNFDVTAGVRYKSQDRDRLTRLTSDRPDSQAVYVGTAFMF